jgi:hypothetical protein
MPVQAERELIELRDCLGRNVHTEELTKAASDEPNLE